MIFGEGGVSFIAGIAGTQTASSDQRFSLKYSQSQHHEVVCATAGSSLLWLKQQFQRFHPELLNTVAGGRELTLEEISVETIREFNLQSFFERTASGELKIKISALPEYLRIEDSDGRIPLETSLKLSRYSLLGLRKLIEIGGANEAFKNFAIGLFIQDERFDGFMCRGQKFFMPLGEVFNYVVFALCAMESGLDLSRAGPRTPEVSGDAASSQKFGERPREKSPEKSPEKPRVSSVFGVFHASRASEGPGVISSSEYSKIFSGWNILNDQLMRGSFFLCPTARRHELVAVLGEVGCPEVYVFHDPIKFLEQCVDEFLNQRSQEFYEKNSIGYLGWMKKACSQKNMEGVVDDFFRDSHTLLEKGLDKTPAGAGSGGFPADFEKDRDSGLETAIKNLRAFIFGRLRTVGLIQSTALAASAGESYAIGEMLLKAISDRLPLENLETCRAYLESRPVPKLLEKSVSLAFQRIQYLQEKYPESAAARWVKIQIESDSCDVLHLGNLADEFSENLEILGIIEKYKFIGAEKLLVERELARLSFLKLENLSLFERSMTEKALKSLTPVESGSLLSDRIQIKALIQEKSSGPLVFVSGFFSAWKAAGESEDPGYEEEVKNHLIADFLSMGDFLSPDFIEHYVRAHTSYEEVDGVMSPVLDLDIQTINLILMHALKRPFAERIGDALALKTGEGELSPFFKALIQVIDFIKRDFSGMQNERAVKKDSYPHEWLDLILAGGGIAEFAFQDVNLVNFSRKIKVFQENRWELLSNFPRSQEGMFWMLKTLEWESLISLISDFSFSRRMISERLKEVIFQPWASIKIGSSQHLVSVLSGLLKFKKEEGFLERLMGYVKDALAMPDIQKGLYFQKILCLLDEYLEIRQQFFENFILQPDLAYKLSDASIFLTILEAALKYPGSYAVTLQFAVKYLEREEVFNAFRGREDHLHFLDLLIPTLRLLGASDEFLGLLNRKVRKAYIGPLNASVGRLSNPFMAGAGGAGVSVDDSSTARRNDGDEVSRSTDSAADSLP